MKFVISFSFLAVFLLAFTSCANTPTSPSASTTNATNIYSYYYSYSPLIRIVTTSYATAALMDAAGNPLVEMSPLALGYSAYFSVTQGDYLLGYRFWTNTNPSNWFATPWMSNPAPISISNFAIYAITISTSATNAVDFFVNTNKSVVRLTVE